MTDKNELENKIMTDKPFSLGEETEQVEFKKSTGELKEGVISIASILNKHGSGDLYFGVKNNGDVIGQEISDKTMREISQAIRAGIKPAIYPVIEKLRYDGNDVVHVRFEGKSRPYLAYGIPRIRIADEDTVMDQELYNALLRERESHSSSWESLPSKYHVADIDKTVFDAYLRKARQVGRITLDNDDAAYVLTKLGLADGDTLLNAGAALFVDCGINELQMARFASDERLTFNDIKRYTGSIFDLADKAVMYVADAMDWRVEFDGSLERKEIPEVPIDAVREAVINAFGHRIIESAQSVEVAVYKSYIEIYSPGKSTEHVTPEQFVTQALRPIRRNPLITRTLYYSKDMESFATGLKRINDACTQSGVKVEFYGDEYGFMVRFYRHCGEAWSDATAPNVPKHQNEALGEALDEALDEALKDRLISAIKQNPNITQQTLADELAVSRASVQRLCKTLSERGIIVRKDGKRYGYWEVRD